MFANTALNSVLKNLNLCLRNYTTNCSVRAYSTKNTRDLKKFYKLASISKTDDGYEVNLDKFKLKTPKGQLFKVPNEALALGVATEWNAQQSVVKRHTMSLTSLCNMAIDNPTGRSKETVIGGILELLDTDTICYRMEEPEELVEFQRKNWDPLLHWFHDRYSVHLDVTTGLGVLAIPPTSKEVLKQHLNSYNDWALLGYQHAVEYLKSFIIATAVIDRSIDVERAVELARLEIDYQTSLWGDVEWHHGIDKLDLNARLAAATLFVHLNSNDFSMAFNKSAYAKPI